MSCKVSTMLWCIWMILISGSREKSHLATLDEILFRLNRAALRVKRNKCAFMKMSVTYLGHQFDEDRLHPLQDRVTAIQEAPTPTSVSTLKSYLDMLSYYSKFLPNISSHLQPLYKMLCKDV